MATKAKVRIAWNGDKLVKETERGAAEGVFEAATLVKEQMQINVGIVGPPRSLPGEFPHIDTKELWESIKIRGSRKKLEARVVVEAPYALALEFGHGSVAPRPFILRSMEQSRTAATKAIVGAIKKGQGNIRFAD